MRAPARVLYFFHSNNVISDAASRVAGQAPNRGKANDTSRARCAGSGGRDNGVPGRQRFQYPGGNSQRLGQPDRQPRAAPLHLPDGRAGLRQEPVSLEHRRPAHLVHHPGEQARLHRAEEGDRHPRRDESRDGARGRDGPGPGGGGHLRRTPQAQRPAQRPRLLRGAVRQAGRTRMSRREAPQARAEHDLRRDAGAAAGHRPGGDGQGAGEATGEEGQGARPQPGGAACRLRVRLREPREAGPVRSRAHGGDGRADPDRGERRRGDRLHDGRRHGRHVVPDHALVQLVRDADDLHAEVPHGQGNREGHLRDRPGRRRD